MRTGFLHRNGQKKGDSGFRVLVVCRGSAKINPKPSSPTPQNAHQIWKLESFEPDYRLP